MSDEIANLQAETLPAVARTEGGLPPLAVAGGFGALAIALFLVLNGQREAEARSLTTPTGDSALMAPAPPLELPEPAAPPPPTAAPAPAMVAPLPAPAPLPMVPASPAVDDGLERRKAPAVVVDLGAGGRAMVLAQAAPAGAGAASSTAPASAAAPEAAALTPTTVEAATAQMRLGGMGGETAAMAVPATNLGLMVPQGAIIPAVLETAINSDLPGYTRAVVSRDVYSFDGRNVLIPRGSRLIGQYRSAVSLGQSRAFVIWSRVVRPDGVSVQIGSPGTDELGRGGLTGEVDRHFFSRFGGSILLSVLNAGVAAIGGTPSTQIAIGSPSQANAAASAVQTGDNIVPTIKVAQGEGVRIFVARDLDFSAVGPMR